MDNVKTAFEKWNQIAPGAVIESEAAKLKYGMNTVAANSVILGAISPVTVEQVSEIMKVANENKVAVYPFSTGHNWGYGGPTPVKDHCVILDLSKMNKIICFDEQLGLITIEPGVTQGQLKNFLEDNNYSFVVPVTGAGPTCSLLGNALDRGYGLNPYVDHFAAVNAIEAVLANGELYRTPHTELGCVGIDRAFKWGVGPYLDGLFAQGNVGVVTAVTIALAPKPEYELGFIFNVGSDQELIKLTDSLRSTLQSVGVNMGSVKLTNQHRLISILELFPETVGSAPFLTLDNDIDAKLKSKRIHAWMGSSVIYGDKAVVLAVKSLIKKKLGPHVKDLFFLNPKKFSKLISFLKYIPILNSEKNKIIAKKLEEFLMLLSGVPSQIALPIAYAKQGKLPSKNELLNPDKDNCGLIWFSPLLPMQSKHLESYVKIVKRILVEYQFEPILTLTTLSNACFDSAVPILFDKNNQEELQRAEQCYRSLFTECQKAGYLPYRMPVNFMDLYVTESSPYWRLVKKIKAEFDPNSIISPGRYSL